MTSERHRMLASVAFVAVLIVIGIPLWWKTTQVYRVALPYAEIEALKSAPVRVGVKIKVLANDGPTAFEVGDLLRQRLLTSDILEVKVETDVLDEDVRSAIYSVAEEAEAAEILVRAGVATGAHVVVAQRSRLTSAAWLGEQSVVLFRDSAATLTVAEVLEKWVLQTSALQGALAARSGSDVARATRLPPRDNYDVTLSVAHPAPHHYKLEFPAKEALEDYIGTFLDDLSHLHNFTLRSQWIHLLEVDLKAKKTGAGHVVRRAQLPHALSALEARSGARAAAATPVRLILYALPCHLAPLYIADDKGEIIAGSISGFVSARWGGVVLASPGETTCAPNERQPRLFVPDVSLVMGTFLAQLRELLGISKLPRIDDAALSPLRSVRARRWEIDALTRVRTLEQINSAVLTLNSIAQLLDKIPNIVINDEVGASIRSATDSVACGCRAARAGDAAAAHAHSLRAMIAAERAFTSPSLLALLYFPDDQKYAVYIPLFLPVMIPVLISLKNIAAWLRGTAKEKTE